MLTMYCLCPGRRRKLFAIRRQVVIEAQPPSGTISRPRSLLRRLWWIRGWLYRGGRGKGGRGRRCRLLGRESCLNVKPSWFGHVRGFLLSLVTGLWDSEVWRAEIVVGCVDCSTYSTGDCSLFLRLKVQIGARKEFE